MTPDERAIFERVDRAAAGAEAASFRDGSPPGDGWYFVAFEPGDGEQLVWLTRTTDDLWDEFDVDRWAWGRWRDDDPEMVRVDVADPLAITWRKADEASIARRVEQLRSDGHRVRL